MTIVGGSYKFKNEKIIWQNYQPYKIFLISSDGCYLNRLTDTKTIHYKLDQQMINNPLQCSLLFQRVIATEHDN